MPPERTEQWQSDYCRGCSARDDPAGKWKVDPSSTTLRIGAPAPRKRNLCFDGERVFVVSQPKRHRGPRGYAAPFDNGFQNRKTLSDPDPYALRGSRIAP